MLVSGSKPIQQAKTAHGIRSSDFARLYIITLAVSVGDVGGVRPGKDQMAFYWCVMNYYAFHIGDYKAHTQHLTPMEDLIYRRMLDLYYLNESPLPDAQKIARSICLRDHISDIETILSEFFVDTPDGFIHSRCEREIKAMNEKSGKAKASAQARWKKSSDANAMRSQCERNANASKTMRTHRIWMRTQCETDANAMLPIPNTQYPIPKKKKNAGNVFRVRHSLGFSPCRWTGTLTLMNCKKYVNGKIHAGKPLTLEQVMEHLPGYREATHAKGERRTESEWCRALVIWAQRCLLNPKSDENLSRLLLSKNRILAA